MPRWDTIGGLFSVALSVDASQRRPGVTWQHALWSPDFPRTLSQARDHPADSIRTQGNTRR